MIIPLAGIALPLILVPIVLIASHVARMRRYAHEERMASIKAGIAPPSRVPLPGPGSIIAIGAGVPALAMNMALGVSLSLDPIHPESFPMMAITWGAAMVVSIGGLGAALVLGLLLHRAHRRNESDARGTSAKPTYDPDMFEAAGRPF